MNEYTPISHLQIGQIYNQIFLIHSSIRFPKRIELELVDVTGKIKAVYWNKPLPLELIEDGKYVTIVGKVRPYKESKQINIETITNYSGTPLNITDYIGGPNEGILSHYCSLLNSYIEQIEDPHYRDLLNYSINKLNIVEMLKNSPYGLTGPMANKGGLLLHTVHHLQIIFQTTNSFCENNDLKINKSLLMLGCIFRHLGWSTTTFIKGSSAEPLDAFYTISPQMSSFRLIDHACLGAENDLQITLPEGHKQALSNVCLDMPSTIEGKLIVATNETTNLLENSHNILIRTKNKNWSQDLFVGHL